MLYSEYDPEVEMRVVREEALEDGIEIGREEILTLFEQGLSVEEIRERLQLKEKIF
jgi:DNA-binding NarL/FixJ family response regulator